MAVLIVIYQSIKNTLLLHVLYIKIHYNYRRAKITSVDHDFLLLRPVLMFRLTSYYHGITHLILLIILRLLSRQKLPFEKESRSVTS